MTGRRRAVVEPSPARGGAEDTDQGTRTMPLNGLPRRGWLGRLAHGRWGWLGRLPLPAGRRGGLLILGAVVLVVLLLGLVAVPAGLSAIRSGVVGAQAAPAISRTSPALGVGQARDVYARADARIQDAETKRSAAAADAAYTGPEREAAAARWRIMAAAKSGPTASAAPAGRMLLTSGQDWPRFLMVQTRSGPSRPVSLRLLTTTSVRTPYRMWGEATLLPGAELPQTADPLGGAPVLGPDTPGLAATPQKAVSAYASLLTTGSAGAGAPAFESDRFLTDVRANAAGQAKDVSRFATFKQTHTPLPGGMWSIRTSDGGALVMAAMTRTDAFTVKPGTGTLAAPAQYRALAGAASKISKQATVRTLEWVVIVVPHQAGAKLQVLAAGEQAVAVEAH